MAAYRAGRLQSNREHIDTSDVSAPLIRHQASELIQHVARATHPEWGGGVISASAYETAWVALVRHPHHPGKLAFPSTLEWLVRHQRTDGGWGELFPYSLLPALAGLLALRRAPHSTPQIIQARSRAWTYLMQRLPAWDITTFDTPLFEFLVPALLTELADPALAQQAPGIELMTERTRAKLTRVPLDLIYTGQSPLIHGLEAFGQRLDFDRLLACQAENGSFGNSPAATAAVLHYGPTWNPTAARWLTHLVRQTSDEDQGGMPTSHPADVFEIAWVLAYLTHGGVPLDRRDRHVNQLLAWLRESLTEQGASFARGRGLPPDVDDTAMVITVLRAAGIAVPLDALWRFADGDHFANYAGERTASASANAHVLDALLTAGDEVATQRDQCARYLLDQRRDEGYWQDKWHLSPYYATAACVLPLARVPKMALRYELQPTLTWLLQTFQDTGWGVAEPTSEETAYAVLMLQALADLAPGPQRAQCQAALAAGHHLLTHHLISDHPVPASPLWVDKTLYHPLAVTRAALVAALHATTPAPVFARSGRIRA